MARNNNIKTTHSVLNRTPKTTLSLSTLLLDIKVVVFFLLFVATEPYKKDVETDQQEGKRSNLPRTETFSFLRVYYFLCMNTTKRENYTVDVDSSRWWWYTWSRRFDVNI